MARVSVVLSYEITEEVRAIFGFAILRKFDGKTVVEHIACEVFTYTGSFSVIIDRVFIRRNHLGKSETRICWMGRSGLMRRIRCALGRNKTQLLSLLSPLSRCWHCAELAEHTDGIPIDPILDDLAISHTENVYA